MCVGGAGVGDDEDLRRADGVRLEAELWLEFYSLGVSEVVAIDHEALEADDQGLIFEQFLFEDGGVGAVVFSAEGGGLPGGAFDEVGEADAVFSEAVVVFHCDGHVDEAGAVEGSPEAVSGVGEVVAALDGDLGGIEAHEDYVEVGLEVVGEGVHGNRSFWAFWPRIFCFWAAVSGLSWTWLRRRVWERRG